MQYRSCRAPRGRALLALVLSLAAFNAAADSTAQQVELAKEPTRAAPHPAVVLNAEYVAMREEQDCMERWLTYYRDLAAGKNPTPPDCDPFDPDTSTAGVDL